MRQWTKEVGGVTSTGKSRVLIDRISQSIIIIVSQLKEGLFDPKIQGGCRSMQRRFWKLDRTRKKGPDRQRVDNGNEDSFMDHLISQSSSLLVDANQSASIW